jgi:hypothetical protein
MENETMTTKDLIAELRSRADELREENVAIADKDSISNVLSEAAEVLEQMVSLGLTTP